MQSCQLLVQDQLSFSSNTQALDHIAETLINAEIVRPSYLTAIHQREQHYPTGIALDGYAIAIPHCEAEHANRPALYIIKTIAPVAFERADDDGCVEVSLIIALVVTDPAAQLNMLRALFSALQEPAFYQTILSSSNDDISLLFQQKILNNLE